MLQLSHFFSTLPQKKHHGLLYDFDGIHEIYVEDIAPLPCFDWVDWFFVRVFALSTFWLSMHLCIFYATTQD